MPTDPFSPESLLESAVRRAVAMFSRLERTNRKAAEDDPSLLLADPLADAYAFSARVLDDALWQSGLVPELPRPPRPAPVDTTLAQDQADRERDALRYRQQHRCRWCGGTNHLDGSPASDRCREKTMIDSPVDTTLAGADRFELEAARDFDASGQPVKR